MKKVVYTTLFLLMLFGMTVPVYAGIEMMSEDQAKGITDEMITGFKLGMNKSGQETTTGCTNNPMEPMNVDTIEPLELPSWEDDFSFSRYIGDHVSPTASLTSSPYNPRQPRYPDDPNTTPTTDPETPVTPEPATMMIMGLGLVALAPFARRKQRQQEIAE